jgi:hypothetical protein
MPDPPGPEAPPLERLLELAIVAARFKHCRWKEGTKAAIADGHHGAFYACPHPDCALIRAEGEARRRVPPDLDELFPVDHVEQAAYKLWHELSPVIEGEVHERAIMAQHLRSAFVRGMRCQAELTPAAPLVRSRAPHQEPEPFARQRLITIDDVLTLEDGTRCQVQCTKGIVVVELPRVDRPRRRSS